MIKRKDKRGSQIHFPKLFTSHQLPIQEKQANLDSKLFVAISSPFHLFLSLFFLSLSLEWYEDLSHKIIRQINVYDLKLFDIWNILNFRLFNYQIQKLCLTPDKSSKVSTAFFSLRTLHWNSSYTHPAFIKKYYRI